MMMIRSQYGTVGDPGYQSSIAELIDLAAEKVPANAIPPLMSVKLAAATKDPKRMGDAAERLLGLGWPGLDDRMRGDVKEQVKLLADALRVDGRTEEAIALMTRLAESESRDVFIKLTWKGKADIDLAVAEPFGATANFNNPRTVFGGAIIKNGYGGHPEEVYVCPRGFDGEYAIAVQKIVDFDPAKPVDQATLEVVFHEGSPDERREIHSIDLTKPTPIVVKLSNGRRKTVLPFIAPPKPPAVKTKAAPNPKPPAARPDAPKPAPFR
jgi:hypothetical protein